MNAQRNAARNANQREGGGGQKTLTTIGVVIAWIWSKLMVIVGLAAVVLLVWGLFFWTDAKAESTMREELATRAFGEITTIDAPLYVQSHLLGDYGTYSAKAGNCRVTITTPDGRPSVEVDSTDPNGGAVKIEDADMTKLWSTPELRYCFA